MPSSETTQLRIYCVCGQKMKVSEDMFGRPGKCVACRQKIRIPTPDELPANTNEIYLKDHPEFLRKVKHRPADDREVSPPPEDDGKRQRVSVPFDVLEPLRQLCNLRSKADKQLQALDELGPKSGKSESSNRAELLGHRTRIKNLQADLEEELRQRLMESAIELSSVQEKIAELSLGVRVGELTFPEFQEQVDRLRRKRDHFERRQANLRGWLTVDDPYMAGGHQDVSLSQIPRSLPRVSLPAEPEAAGALLNLHVEELRAAFEQRAVAERKLSEAERMKTGAAMSERSVEECLAEADAARSRARARVQFSRDRLEQLAEDFASDMDAVDAQMDHARGRLKAGRSGREEFNNVERNCLRARGDLTKARALVVRALAANTADEVPRLRGTFLERLAKPTKRTRTPAESWVAFVSAALMLGVLFMPIAGESTPLELFRTLSAQGAEAHWLVSFPMITAILIALISFVPQRTFRGLALAVVWLLAGLLSAVYFHESSYAMGMVAERLREGVPLLQRTGIVVYLLSLVGLGIASAIALMPPRDTRPVFPVVALVMAVGLGAIFTDFGGIRVANPTISVVPTPVEGYPNGYDATITVRNDGARIMMLASGSTMANAYEFILENKIGESSWSDAGAPVSIMAGGREYKMAPTSAQIISIPSGGEATMTYRLSPGTYRVLLQTSDTAKSRQREFTLDAPATTGTTAPAEAGTTAKPADGESQPALSPELLRQISPQVILRGVMATPGKPANFSIMVMLPDGRSRAETYSVGDEVYDGWVAGEFNPQEQTVTLTKGDDILILRRGETYVLAPPNGPAS